MRFFNKYKRTVIYFIVTWRWTILNVVFKKRKKGKYLKSSQKEPWLMCLRIVPTKCVNRMKARAIRPLCWPPPNKFISIRESVRLQRRWNNIDNILDTLASNEMQFIEKRNMVYRIREIHVQFEKVCGCKKHWQHSWHSCFRRNTIYRKEKYSVQNLRNKSLRGKMADVFVISFFTISLFQFGGKYDSMQMRKILKRNRCIGKKLGKQMVLRYWWRFYATNPRCLPFQMDSRVSFYLPRS